RRRRHRLLGLGRVEQPQGRPHPHRDLRDRHGGTRARAVAHLRGEAREPRRRRLTMDKYIEIDTVGMVFARRGVTFEALSDISLTVARGEFVTLIGHSGCGKSTLLNLLAGLLRPASGHLLLAN